MRGRVVTAAGLGLAGVLLSASCQEKGRPDPGVQMAVSREREAPASGGPEGSAGTETSANAQIIPVPKMAPRITVPIFGWVISKFGSFHVISAEALT